MKIKATLVTLIAAAAALFCLCGCSMNKYKNADKYTTGDREISEKITNLDINWVAGDIKISCHKRSTVGVSEKGAEDLKEARKMHTWVDGDTLHVQFCKSGEMMFFETPKKDLYIELPEGTELSDLKLDGTSCDCTVSGLTFETIDADVTSGDLTFLDCKAKEVKTDSSSGTLNLVLSGETDKISADSSSGSVNITAEKVGSIDVDTSSGNICIDVKEADKVSTDASSGDTKLKFGKVPDNINVDSSSGDVSISVPKNSDFEAEVDTSSGEFYSEIPLSKSGDTYTAGSGSSKMSIDTSSGDVTILVN